MCLNLYGCNVKANFGTNYLIIDAKVHVCKTQGIKKETEGILGSLHYFLKTIKP